MEWTPGWSLCTTVPANFGNDPSKVTALSLDDCPVIEKVIDQIGNDILFHFSDEKTDIQIQPGKFVNVEKLSLNWKRLPKGALKGIIEKLKQLKELSLSGVADSNLGEVAAEISVAQQLKSLNLLIFPPVDLVKPDLLAKFISDAKRLENLRSTFYSFQRGKEKGKEKKLKRNQIKS